MEQDDDLPVEMTPEQIKEERNRLKPWQFKKGQIANPKGRPPGKSLKQYSREMLAAMSDEERQKFLHGIDKEAIWKFAEGNPTSTNEHTGKDGDAIKVEVDTTIAIIHKQLDELYGQRHIKLDGDASGNVGEEAPHKE